MEKSDKKLTVGNAQDLIQVKITAQDIIKYFCPLATEKEVFMALGVIRSLNLNPHKKEVHMIKYSKESPISIVVGYEVYIKRAERTGKLNGWEVGISEDKKKAWIKIYRKDWTKEFYWEIELSEFSKNQATWKQIPTFMGKKVVIAQGFRLAFPDELGGLPYTQEEHEVFDIGAEIVSSKPAVAMPEEIKPTAKVEREKVDTVTEDVFPEEQPIGKELNVIEALEQPEKAEFDMWGVLFSFKTRKVKTPKGQSDMVDYSLSPREGTQLITVSKFGSACDGVENGDTLLLRGVKTKIYKDEMNYLATGDVEILEKGKAQ